MRGYLIGLLVIITPPIALAGPKEDAQAAFEKFFPAFTAAKIEDVITLFAPDALFYGTSTRDLVTTPEGVRGYFANAFGTPPRAAGVDTATPIGSPTVVMVSDTAAVISGKWQVDSKATGQNVVRGPYRVTAALAKRGDRWQIVQFHNSPVPAAP